MDHRTIVSFFTCQLVWVNRYRASAWHGIQAAWQAEQETVAAILNAINGWRQELEDQRGKSRRLDALDLSCHQGTWIAPPWRP